jgi:hypothetical protein
VQERNVGPTDRTREKNDAGGVEIDKMACSGQSHSSREDVDFAFVAFAWGSGTLAKGKKREARECVFS